MEKAFFVYAWDLIAEGPENALGKIQDLDMEKVRADVEAAKSENA